MSLPVSETKYDYCAVPLAAYACRADQTKGRLIAEPESATRTAFQRDRDRIIHSSAFRRLKGKTQVFVAHEGDRYRTRLTHTMEVAQIARDLARSLMLNEDLAEAVALSHDLGHPPFAHMGEDKLKEKMKDFGGFEHNDQSLRIVVLLEQRYAKWNGLNLSWETIEGIVKHNGPVTYKPGHTLEQVQKQWDLQLNTWPSLEAQVAGISDDIAYNSHDIEDGLFENLFTLDDIASAVPLVERVWAESRNQFADLPHHVRVHEIVREILGRLVTDVLDESRQRIANARLTCVEDVRACGRQLVAFSPSMAEHVKAMRAFLMPRMYHHQVVRDMRVKAEKIVEGLFDTAMQKISGEDAFTYSRKVADDIAAMTDRQAMAEYEQIFGIKI
jgi:dGTPase